MGWTREGGAGAIDTMCQSDGPCDRHPPVLIPGDRLRRSVQLLQHQFLVRDLVSCGYRENAYIIQTPEGITIYSVQQNWREV